MSRSGGAQRPGIGGLQRVPVTWDTGPVTVRTLAVECRTVRESWRGRVAWSLAAGSIAVALGSVPFIYANGLLGAALLSDHLLTPLVVAVAFALVGGILAASGRGGAVGWVCLAVAVCQAGSLLASQVGRYGVLTNPSRVPGAAGLVWIDSWLWFVGIGLSITVLVNVFPGTPSGLLRRTLSGLGIVGIALFCVAAAIDAWPRRGRALLVAPQDTDFALFEVIGLGLVIVGAVGSAILLVVRMRRSTGRERHQLQLVAFAGAVAVGILGAGTMSLDSWGAISELVALPLLPAAIGVSVVRRRLYDLEPIVSRSVVYAVLTAAVGLAYGIVVAATSIAFGTDGHLLGVVAASAAIAVGFGALRTKVEHIVERRLFGLRRDPGGALAVLADRLASVGNLRQVMSAVVDTVGEALKLSYVHLEVDGPGRPNAVAVGRPISTTAVVELIDQGQSIGRLTIGIRDGHVDRESHRAIAQLAGSVAASLHAAQLTEELQRARERLVAALEEERRRVRRDLHDGLGPALAGILFQLEALTNVVDPEPGPAWPLLHDLRSEVRTLVDDTRRIVHGMRPPALDEYGLAEALRRHAARLSGGANAHGMVLEVEGPADLGKLPAAVEVAAFRIVTEATTNVINHAHASRCTVRLGRSDVLHLEVIDDGVGVDPGTASGIGLRSMHERAAEVGGWLQINVGVDGGTAVVAALPLEAL